MARSSPASRRSAKGSRTRPNRRLLSSPASARNPAPNGKPALLNSATRVANSVASSTESLCDMPKIQREHFRHAGLSPCQTKQREGFHPFVLRFIADKSDEWASPTEQPIAYGIETRRSMPCCTAMLVASIAASHPPRLANPLRPLRVLRGPSSRFCARLAQNAVLKSAARSDIYL